VDKIKKTSTHHLKKYNIYADALKNKNLLPVQIKGNDGSDNIESMQPMGTVYFGRPTTRPVAPF
jgi:hypothetical protein